MPLDFSAHLEFVNGLRENELLCNATVEAKDGAAFKVHSAMLMANSDFFKAAFEFGPGEGTRGVARPLVRLPCVSGDVLDAVVRFIYLRQVDLDCATVWKIFLAADFLRIPDLETICLDFMKCHLSLPQCTKIFEMTHNVFMPKVQEMAMRFTLQNLCKPSFKLRQQQRAALELLRPECLRRVLQDDVLNAPREQFVWEALIEWLESGPGEQRTQFLDQLLNTIRIGLLPRRFVSDNVLGYPAVQQRPDLVKQVQDLDQAVEQMLAGDAPLEVLPPAMRPRLPHTVLLSIGGWVNGAPSLEVQLYDLAADAWTQVSVLENTNPEYTMAYHGLARLGEHVYVIGGTENGTDTTRCLRLNLKTFRWEVLPSLTQSRDFVSVAALNGRIYAIGGRSNPHHSRNKSAEFYDPATNKWSPIAEMNHSRSDAGCTVYAGKIYVVGGFTGESVLSSSEVYDPELDTWQLLPEMVTPRSGVRCVTLRKHIYVVGGFSGAARLASMERLDPERGIWIPMEPMLTPRSNLGVAAVGDEILAIGGYNGRSVDASVEVYNVFEDKWYELADLPTARSALDVLALEDASELALALLGADRSQPRLLRKDREAHRPEYGASAAPGAELPAGSTSFGDDVEPEWDDVLDPFGLALLLPGGAENEEASFWSQLRLFGTPSDDSEEVEDIEENGDVDELDTDESDWLDADVFDDDNSEF